jgi:hypothetical protein
MKKWSYWLSFVIGGVAGLFINEGWEVFKRANKAISYQQNMFVKDTTIIAANGQTKAAHILHGALWNSGKTTIDSTEVREPLLITVAGADEILHYKLKREVHPQTSRFRLGPATKTSFSVHWQYFDPGDGFSFRILYVGDKKAEVKPKGRVLYVEGFDKVKPQILDIKKGLIVLIIMVFVAMLASFYIYKTLYRGKYLKLALLLLFNLLAGYTMVIFATELIRIIQNPPFEVYLGG